MIRKIDSESKECREFIEELFLRRTLIPEQVLETVSNIIDEVREKGDDALLSFTLRFDGVEMDAKMLKVSVPEMEDAVKNRCKPLRVIARAAENIRKFHERQKSESWFYTGENGEILGQRHTPMERVGIYVPGGTAPLVSSVLMTAIPAKVAGVERVIMATPPQKDGSINPAVLAAAQAAGVDEVYRIGGAQAVAAMAFGTDTIPWVDKIVGPGNIYVTTAKKLVYGTVGIDMVAGPSEITVIADDTANRNL